MLKRKKEENLKPLSEREIQEKLYGRYRPGDGNSEGGAGRAHASDAGTFFSVPSFSEGVSDSGHQEHSVRGVLTASAELSSSEVPDTEHSKTGLFSSLLKFTNLSAPLNEREIQEKLYGRFARKDLKSEDADEPTGKFEEPSRQGLLETANSRNVHADPPLRGGGDKLEAEVGRKKNGRKKSFSLMAWLSGFSPALNEREIQRKLYGRCEENSKADLAEIQTGKELFRQKEIQQAAEGEVFLGGAENVRPSVKRVPLAKKKNDEAFLAIKTGGTKALQFVLSRSASILKGGGTVSRVLGACAVVLVAFVAFRFLSQWSSSIDFSFMNSGKTLSFPLAAPTDASLPAEVQGAAGNDFSEATDPIKPSPAPAAIPKKFYTIQVVVYEDSKLAQKLISDFKAKKLDAFMVQTTTRRGRQHFEVFVGRFPSVAEADQQLSQYRKKDFLKDFPDSFIRPRFE